MVPDLQLLFSETYSFHGLREHRIINGPTGKKTKTATCAVPATKIIPSKSSYGICQEGLRLGKPADPAVQSQVKLGVLPPPPEKSVNT